MHEIGIVRSMCKTVLDYAKENNVQKISEIVCEVGELSLVIPEYVVQYEGYCPNCGSFDKDVLSGQDFTIKEIHVP